MATLQVRNGSYRVLFCYAHRRHSYTLGPVPNKEAELAAANIDRLLLRLEQGLLKVPQSVDIVTFLKHDGKIEEAPVAPRPMVTLKQLKERYELAHGNGVMEESSLKSWSIHCQHLLKTLGYHFAVQSLSLARLQEHVDERRTKKGIHGKRLSTATLKKEIGSLRAAWNWGLTIGIVEGHFPSKGLLYPKTDEKPPFQTFAEIERQIALGGLTPTQERDLWDCLFLTLEDIQELLKHVDDHAEHRFIYPMVCFAAHTGARRSEMLRLRWHDVDFASSSVLLHEKKRNRNKRTTRRISLSPFLQAVLKAWQSEHPGGSFVFSLPAAILRSKKSRTAMMPLSRNEAHDHFSRTVQGSKWAKMRGWHVLRHSFASNCAAKGIDQRIIDEWMGHQTEEMRRRYRHLIPNQQQAAMQHVFGTMQASA